MVKTMKKSLAVILALTVCLSVLCIPASATGSTAANNFPYMLCNYENDFVNISGGTIVEGGMGGSGHALQITTTSGSDYSLKNKWGSNFGATIPAGSTLRISFNIKLSAAVSGNATFALISYQLGGYAAETKLSSPAADTWHKVTIDYVATEEKVMQAAWLRSGVSQTYLIDDFEAMILPAEITAADVDKVDSLDGYNMTFENGGSIRIMQAGVGYPTISTTAKTNGGETIQIVANPDGEGNVMKLDLADSQTNEGTVCWTSSIGGTGRPTGTIPAGGTITYTFNYYFPQEMATSNNPAICMYHAANAGEGLVTAWAEGSGFATSANEWHTGTLTYTNETDAEVKIGRGEFRMGASNNPSRSFKVATLADGETGFGARTIYFDNLRATITAPGDVVPTPVTSSNLVVNGNAVEGHVVSFDHTFTPASTSASGVTDASVVRIVSYTASGEKAVIDYCGIGENFIFPATPANSARMMIEVVPVGSDGTMGDIVEYAIPAATPEIEGITITRTENGITVTTDTELIAAKLIFVNYSNNRMASYDMDTTVDLDAFASDEYVIPDGFESAKVMLWTNMDTCIPLAASLDAIQ